MTLQIKKLGHQDIELFNALITLFEEVFEMKYFTPPPASYLQQLLAEEQFYVFVAWSDNHVIGGLTAYSLKQYYSIAPLVYVFDLAVEVAYQRKGVGRRLISAINDYCRSMGAEEVFVQADEADGYALDFYRSTGATAENVVHFYYPLNKK